MALLPLVGTRRRDRSAGEYGSLHGEQLLDIGFLEELA
jgi:hypothetical protein